MRMRKLLFVPVMLAVVACLAACPGLGLQPAGTFKEKLAYAYSTHTALQNAAASSLAAHEITSADAEAVLKIADESRQVLDAAKVADSAGDPKTAEGRLLLATSILEQLQTYLRSKGGGS